MILPIDTGLAYFRAFAVFKFDLANDPMGPLHWLERGTTQAQLAEN